jgi:hypothetical protein
MNVRQSAAMIVAMVLAAGLAGCASSAPFAAEAGMAHNQAAWAGHEAIEAEIQVVFGNTTVFAGRLLASTDGSQARLVSQTGATVVFDGKEAWVSPAEAVVPAAAYQVRAWPAFLRLPFSLTDKHAKFEMLGDKPIWDKPYMASKMTFAEPVAGMAPWYTLYQEPGTKLIRSAAYPAEYDALLVTKNNQPLAVIYNRFLILDGVKLSTEWSFFVWNEATGISGTPLGRVALSGVQWVTPGPGAFKPADGARLLGDSQAVAAAK